MKMDEEIRKSGGRRTIRTTETVEAVSLLTYKPPPSTCTETYGIRHLLVLFGQYVLNITTVFITNREGEGSSLVFDNA